MSSESDERSVGILMTYINQHIRNKFTECKCKAEYLLIQQGYMHPLNTNVKFCSENKLDTL